jgi:hypothetical protein
MKSILTPEMIYTRNFSIAFYAIKINILRKNHQTQSLNGNIVEKYSELLSSACTLAIVPSMSSGWPLISAILGAEWAGVPDDVQPTEQAGRRLDDMERE